MKVIDFYPYNWEEEWGLLSKMDQINALLKWGCERNKNETILKIEQEYLYWTKVKHYANKFELSEKIFWALIKKMRSEHRIAIFILANRDYMTYSVDEIVQKKLYIIDDLVMQILSEKESDMDDLLEAYYQDGLIEESIATSQFEGAKTKRSVAKDMLYSGRQPKDFHEKMIVNVYKASKELLLSPNKMSVDSFVKLHNQLIVNTKQTLQADDFNLRTDGVEIEKNNKVVFKPISDSRQIQDSVNILLLWINNEIQFSHFIHPVIKAIVIHYWIAYIHPFYDGNGRTARMMFYWFISQHKQYEILKYIPISTTISKSRKGYEDAFLFVEHDEHDLNYFIHYHLDIIQKSLIHFKEHLAESQKSLKIAAQNLASYKLNWRQIRLIQHAQRHPDTRYTIRAHQEINKINRITATKDLETLVSHGFFSETKLSKIRLFAFKSAMPPS